jgi:hypothetical protein
MKNFKLLSILFLVSLIIISCDKEKQEPKVDFSKFIIGEWYVKQIVENGVEELLDDCDKLSTMEFTTTLDVFAISMVTYDDGSGKPYCTSLFSPPDIALIFKYSLIGTKLTFDYGDDTGSLMTSDDNFREDFIIEKISNDKFKILWNDQKGSGYTVFERVK